MSNISSLTSPFRDLHANNINKVSINITLDTYFLWVLMFDVLGDWLKNA